MLTQHSVLKHGGLYWDREVLPPDGYRRRFARIQARVAQSGDEGWIVYGDVMRYGTVTYVTNFMPRVRSAFAFVPAEGEPVLFANCGKRDVPAAKTITWVEDVRPFGRLAPEVVGFLESAQLTRGRIGHAGLDASIPVADWTAIAKALPDVDWRARDAELTALRAVKEDWEAAAVARAAGMADTALAEAPALLQPGVSMRAVIAGIDRVARAEGAEDVRYLVASGPQAGVALRPVDDRNLGAGDTLLLYVALQTQRYWAEAARTFILGEAPAALRALHDRATGALMALSETANPGVSVSSLAAAAAEAGSTPYGFGNGIGLDAEEPPIVAGNGGGRFSEGATAAFRVILHDGGFGAAVASTGVVGQSGFEAFGEPASLIEVGRT